MKLCAKCLIITVIAWFITEAVCGMVLEYIDRTSGIIVGDDVLKLLYAIPLGVASITFVTLLVVNLRKQKL